MARLSARITMSRRTKAVAFQASSALLLAKDEWNGSRWYYRSGSARMVKVDCLGHRSQERFDDA